MRSFSRTLAGRTRPGYTLVEVLVTMVLLLGLMLLVTRLLSSVNKSISNSRATLEMTDRLRSTVSRLRLDLQGATADTTPPARPEEGEGYLEYIEGPIGPVVALEHAAVRSDEPNPNFDASDPNSDFYLPDTSAGDRDDILALTVRSCGEPFRGKAYIKTHPKDPPEQVYPADLTRAPFSDERTTQSQLAEVIYFVRGENLIRRELLVLPDLDVDRRSGAASEGIQSLAYPYLYGTGRPGEGHLAAITQNDPDPPAGIVPDHGAFYNNFDLSVRFVYNEANPSNRAEWRWVPNTLADLSMRENRFAHQPSVAPIGAPVAFWRHFPFNPHAQILPNGSQQSSDWQYLGLPTLRECSHSHWVAGRSLPALTLSPDPTLLDQNGASPSAANVRYDPWLNTLPFTNVDIWLPRGRVNDAKLDPETGDIDVLRGPRASEDVILTGVIGFDVKIWDRRAPIVADDPSNPRTALVPGDPGYRAALAAQLASGSPIYLGHGAYVDLGYFDTGVGATPLSDFSHNGQLGAGLQRVWDTWSMHYEHDGLDQNGNGLVDEGTDGFDNVEDAGGVDTDADGVVNLQDGVVDDPGEQEAPPPYAAPMVSIQIKLRVKEPDRRQVREVTIIHDFLSK